MRKILPILLATTVYLTTLYPVYAQPVGVGPALQRKSVTDEMMMKEGSEGGKIKPLGLNPALGRIKNATSEARLKQALNRFKDKNKAKRIESINTNLNEINARRTENMSMALEKIADILERVKSKASNVASDDVNSAISEVESQWAEADVAVKAQAAKDYSIVLNTETTAASDAASAKNLLQADLKVTHTQVVEVRQALGSAISSLLSSLGGKNGSN